MRLVFPLLLLTCIYTAQAQSVPDVLRYRFRIEISDSSDQIRGYAEIQFLKPQRDTVTVFDLTAYNDKLKSGMTVSAVQLQVNHKVVSADFSQSSQQLRISTAKGYGQTDTVVAFIAYSGVPSDGLIISKNKFGHRSFFADNWPNRGHNWIPCHDVQWDKAAVEFIVTAPDHYQVVANGIEKEKTDLAGERRLTHWVEDIPISTKVMVIGVAAFAVERSGTVNGCVPVYSWVYPEDRVAAFTDYSVASEVLEFYSKLVAPYPFKKLANVESKTIFGGLENANTIFYTESNITGNRGNEDLVAHEIAHQWFGNMATEASFAHLWLSEGFATYFTTLYFESKYGKAKANEMMRDDRAAVVDFCSVNDHPVIDTSSNYMSLLTPNNYQKGSWILHMLRSELGDTVFNTAIRNYYYHYAGRTATSADLQKEFETVSGKKLDYFFKQWLEVPGIPRLNISWTYQAASKKLLVTVDQLQAFPFRFPFELALDKSGSKRVKMQVSQAHEVFSFPLAQRPEKVFGDPGTRLLFTGKLSEKP